MSYCSLVRQSSADDSPAAVGSLSSGYSSYVDVICLPCSNLINNLFILFLYNNNFEGDLGMVSEARLGIVSTADNPQLCGMVPASVRWAHGYNTHNTSLGLPCP